MSELDYDLPQDRIALRPAEPRDQSRLMVVRRGEGGAEDERVEHRRFFNIAEYLEPGDLMITNNTRVLPAKLILYRKSGAMIPGLFVAERAPALWEMMLRTRGKVHEGEELLATSPGSPELGTGVMFLLEKRLGAGMWQVRVSSTSPAVELLPRIGAMPIPPYIEKARREVSSPPSGGGVRDSEWYQTVYAQGLAKSVAAPTAGLHFTPGLLERIAAGGVSHAHVELEVGLGTFLPVETETFEAHVMHRERYAVPEDTVAALRAARGVGGAGVEGVKHGRIVVVGTTAVRTLESAAEEILDVTTAPMPLRGETGLKIAPGFPFQLTDVLVTNFHLPRSTLMALVGALVGVERLKKLYSLAIREGYRFYSYGDAMLILP
jgi:S-adenosylmethionine:tRNA ribosyltransferase-isomerase